MITLEISFGVFVGLGIFAGIAAVGVAGGLVIRNKLRNVSRQLFGTESIVDGLNKQADIAAETPKSVSGMTRLMEPQIMRDFPDFNWSEFKHKAENMLTSALLAISSEQPEKLVDASEDVKNQVLNIIADNQAIQVREVYNNIKIHQTEISNYRKDKGKCIIVIQSAVEYYHYKVSGDHVTEGSKERKVQTKYNVELLYVQDGEEKEFDNAFTTTCPQCGAPVRGLGNMICEYCGAHVVPINTKVWSLHKLYQVDYNHV